MEAGPSEKEPNKDSDEKNERLFTGRFEPLPDPFDGDWRDQLVPLPDGLFSQSPTEKTDGPESEAQPERSPETQESNTTAPESHPHPSHSSPDAPPPLSGA